MNSGFEPLEFLSVYLGLLNLEENRQQSAHQEVILKELNEKFDRLEQLVKGDNNESNQRNR